MDDDNIDAQRRKRNRERIQSDVEERTGEIDGVRLNRSQFLDPGLRLTPPQKPVIESLLRIIEPKQKYFKEQRRSTFEILCANLLYSQHALTVPLDDAYWRKSKSPINSSVVKDVHLLEEYNFIGVKKGNTFLKRYTRIYPKKEFRMALPLRSNPGIDYFPSNFVVLKKTISKGYRHFVNPLTGKKEQKRHIKKMEIPYKPTRETERVTDILRKHWHVCHEHSIELHHPHHEPTYLVTALHASYTNDLHHGGRLYTSTEWGIQQLESDWRQYIKIDGEPTVELDFSGLSIRMLYSKIDSGFDGDPYTGVLDAIPRLDLDEKVVIRHFMKKLLQSILNTDEKADAVGSGNFEIFEQCKRDKFRVRNVLKKHGTSVSELVDMFEQLHLPISEYLYSRVGLELQYLDSRIALKVIHHFNKKRIPVLAVHDSFIVQYRYADQLRDVMSKSYMSVMRTQYPCPIK